MTPDLSYDKEGEDRRAKIKNGMGKETNEIGTSCFLALSNVFHTNRRSILRSIPISDM